MPRLPACSSLLLLCACSAPGPTGSTVLPAQPIEVPASGIQVEINGRGPYSFGLDTGQSIPLLLTPALAGELGLVARSKIPVGDGSAVNQVTADVVDVSTVALGGAVFSDVSGVVLDAFEGRGAALDGSLGFPLFAHTLLTLDAGRIRIEPGVLPPPDGVEVLSYTSTEILPMIEVSVAGRVIPAILDSANPKFLSLPLEEADSLPLRGEPVVVGRMTTLFNEFDVLGADLDGELAIGGHRFTAPRIEFNTTLPDANIGRALLENFRVTFDQRNKRVRLVRRRPVDGVAPQAPALTPVGREDEHAAAAGWRDSDSWLRQHLDCVELAGRGGADLVLLGDSITQSFGGAGRRVWGPGEGALREHLGGFEVANLGISGDRTQHLAWRIDQGTLEGLDPRFVVLLIGTNNLSAGDPPAEVAAGIEAAVERVRARLPRAHLLVLGVLPRGAADDPMREAVAEVNERIEMLEALPRVTVSDLGRHFTRADGALRDYLFARDHLHLSPAGYTRWAELLWKSLAALDAATR